MMEEGMSLEQCGSHEIPAKDGQGESIMTDHGSENVLTYEDKDGEWMLVGDVPWEPENVYHVTVMPCYDKKLEASRGDFVFPVGRERENGHEHTDIAEVDSVLTSGEVLDLIQDFGGSNFGSIVSLVLTNVDDEGHLYGVSSGSAGYAESVFQHAAKILFGKEIGGALDSRTIRNSDFQEMTLQVEGEVVLKFALCYGIRNLQNIVRKIKIGKYDYHFLEVMACPSGCLNGGGQIKPKMGQSAKDLIQLLENVYMQE